MQQPQRPYVTDSDLHAPDSGLRDRRRPIRLELRIRRLVTSTADINDTGRGRTCTALSGRRGEGGGTELRQPGELTKQMSTGRRRWTLPPSDAPEPVPPVDARGRAWRTAVSTR